MKIYERERAILLKQQILRDQESLATSHNRSTVYSIIREGEMNREQFNKLTDDEKGAIKTNAIKRTACNFLILKGLCPNCSKAYIVDGYTCSECGHDITA